MLQVPTPSPRKAPSPVLLLHSWWSSGQRASHPDRGLEPRAAALCSSNPARKEGIRLWLTGAQARQMIPQNMRRDAQEWGEQSSPYRPSSWTTNSNPQISPLWTLFCQFRAVFWAYVFKCISLQVKANTLSRCHSSTV